MPAPAVLLIDHGDLPSLVAVALAPDPAGLVLFCPRAADPAADRRLAAARRHAAAYGASRLIVEEHAVPRTAEASPPARVAASLSQARLLLHAAAAAAGLGCSKIVSPQQVGPDARGVGEALERANMVAALVQVGADPPGPGDLLIDLPLVELTDRQLVDLAEDAGAPWQAFWPCERGCEQPCRACGPCHRWQQAFDESGIGWPWAAVTV
ncbi:MAG: 7-cyano-7-deazaguanine synthase [Planctomycetota bacterium]|jgi:7-cyano-7-deazaguanine synthase in queuosine biosynthesis